MVYVKEASNILQMEERILVGEMNKVLLSSQKASLTQQEYEIGKDQITETAPTQKESEWDINSIIAFQEQESIRLLLKYGFNELNEGELLYQYIFNELEDVSFQNTVYAQILDEYKTLLSNNKIVDAQYFIENGSAEVRKAVIDIVHNRHLISSHWKDRYKISIPLENDESKLQNVAFTNIMRLKQRVIRKMIEENLEKLKSSAEENEISEFQQMHHELKQAEKEIANHLGNVILK